VSVEDRKPFGVHFIFNPASNPIKKQAKGNRWYLLTDNHSLGEKYKIET
jgi:hypothetical protein